VFKNQENSIRKSITNRFSNHVTTADIGWVTLGKYNNKFSWFLNTSAYWYTFLGQFCWWNLVENNNAYTAPNLFKNLTYSLNIMVLADILRWTVMKLSIILKKIIMSPLLLKIYLLISSIKSSAFCKCHLWNHLWVIIISCLWKV
jgi:hypothetical protein